MNFLNNIIEQISYKDVKIFCIQIQNFKKEVKNNNAQKFLWKLLCFTKLYKQSNNKEIQAINQFRSFVKSYINIYNTYDLKSLCYYININYEVNTLIFNNINKLNIQSIQLMTVHNAKGKEFKTVFLPFMTSGSFPMNYKKSKTIKNIPKSWLNWSSLKMDNRTMYINEERRLFYVAVTRAKKQLYFLTTEKRRSNFLSEIDTKLYKKENIPISNKKKIHRIDKSLIYKKLYTHLSDENYIEAHNTIDEIDKISKIEKGLIKIENNNNLKDIVPGVFKKPNLSSSSIETYNNCPLKFKYKYIDKIEEKDRKPFFSLGNTLHKVLELYHSGKNKSIDKLFELLKLNWDSYGYEFEMEEQQYLEDANEMLNKYFNYMKDKKDFVFSTEENFTFELSNCNIKGRCDRIDVTNDNKIKIIDYKTSKKKISTKEALSSIQLGIYAMYVKKTDLKNKDGRKLGNLPDELIYLFLRFDDPEVSIHFTNEQILEFEYKIESIATKILSKQFDPIKGYHCNFCDYKDLICTVWNN